MSAKRHRDHGTRGTHEVHDNGHDDAQRDEVEQAQFPLEPGDQDARLEVGELHSGGTSVLPS